MVVYLLPCDSMLLPGSKLTECIGLLRSRGSGVIGEVIDALPLDCYVAGVEPARRRTVILRDVEPQDEAAWRELWLGYLAFYKQTLAEDVSRATWRRLLDPASLLMGRVAEESGGGLLGFCHYVLHEGSWTAAGLLSRRPVRPASVPWRRNGARHDRGPPDAGPFHRLVACLLAHRRPQHDCPQVVRWFRTCRRVRALPDLPVTASAEVTRGGSRRRRSKLSKRSFRFIRISDGTKKAEMRQSRSEYHSAGQGCAHTLQLQSA